MVCKKVLSAMLKDSRVQKSHLPRAVATTGLWAVLLAAIVLLLNLPWSPAFTELGGDAGLYAYAGSAILHGQLPYRDVWEQKPPIGFYLNALAVALFGRTPWTIWWFDVIWVALTTIVVFLILRKMTGFLAAALGSLAFGLAVMSPGVFQGGNLMELYALLPQVLVIGCAYAFFVTRQNRWSFLGGLAAGLAFMTKQTSIALGMAFFLTLALVALLERQAKVLWRRLALFLAGFLLPLAVAVATWAAAGALGDFMDGVFLHSLVYIGARVPFIKALGLALLFAFPQLEISALYDLAVLSFVPYFLGLHPLLVARFFPGRDKGRAPDGLPPLDLTMLVVYLALPLEIVFASLGGRSFGHYFLALIPALTAVAAYLFWRTPTALRDLRSGIRSKAAWTAATFAVLSLVALAWMGAAAVRETPRPEHLAAFPEIFSRPFTPDDLESYVLRNTTPDDPVLVWHIHVGINFITDRRSPQRVLFPANLFDAPENSRSGLSEFLVEFEKDPPRLILVQQDSSIGLPFVDVPVEHICPDDSCMLEVAEAVKRPSIQADLQKLRQYFLEHYSLATRIAGWLVYRRNQ